MLVKPWLVTLPASLQDLATTKVALAELEGALTSSRRDCARLKEMADTLKAEGAALAQERDKAWEEVGSLMVQLHEVQNRNDELMSPAGTQNGALGEEVANDDDEEEEDAEDEEPATVAAQA